MLLQFNKKYKYTEKDNTGVGLVGKGLNCGTGVVAAAVLSLSPVARAAAALYALGRWLLLCSLRGRLNNA